MRILSSWEDRSTVTSPEKRKREGVEDTPLEEDQRKRSKIYDGHCTEHDEYIRTTKVDREQMVQCGKYSLLLIIVRRDHKLRTPLPSLFTVVIVYKTITLLTFTHCSFTLQRSNVSVKSSFEES